MENLNKSLTELSLKKDYDGIIKVVEQNGSALPKSDYHLLLGKTYEAKGDLVEGKYHSTLAAFEDPLSLSAWKNLSTFESDPLSIQITAPLLSLHPLYLVAPLVLLFAVFSFFLKFTKRNCIITGLLLFLLGVPLMARPFLLPLFTQKSLESKSGNSAIFSPISTIPEGKALIVLKKEEWGYIIFPSEYSGWINIREIRSLAVSSF